MTAVHLTFDDGPDPLWTPRILEVLADHAVPATFFVLSGRAACYPEVVAAITAAGHEVGLHGHLHLRHDTHPDEVVARDTEEALKLLEPQRPRWWRAPHGIFAANTRALAARERLTLVRWTVDAVDWPADRPHDAIVATVEAELAPGAVVLMHDAGGPGASRPTPEPTWRALPRIVEAMRARGLEPAPLDQEAANRSMR